MEKSQELPVYAETARRSSSWRHRRRAFAKALALLCFVTIVYFQIGNLLKNDAARPYYGQRHGGHGGFHGAGHSDYDLHDIHDTDEYHDGIHSMHPRPHARPIHENGCAKHASSNGTSLRHLRKKALELVSKTHLKHNIEHMFTSGPHLAGENMELVNWTRSQFEKNGFETSVDQYDIWLNYPISHRVALLRTDGSVKYELSLEEPALEEDETSGWEDRIPTFHGFSASGNATGELVYANFGRKADFNKLVEEGISVRNKIVLVRYGGLFRGLPVKFAEELGASAVLIYSDPAEDGEITEANGYEPYPKGPARNADAVQRGSVQDLPYAPGDPTTPGYPSLPGEDTNRTEPHGIPGIPSVPISMNDALPLLKALNGHGPQFSNWKGGFDGVEYSVGPSILEVNVASEQDYDFRPNYDVIAKIPGESDEEVIFGNHRDAWVIGAADPNSGSAVILEVARVLGELVKSGWKPKRTIVLASWDGEEYGLLGSTEWGEHYAEHLQKKAIAYINCDVGVSGNSFTASGNPLLREVIERSVDAVELNGTSLSDYWGGSREARLGPLGSGSDFTVFQDHLGIPSLDAGFGPGKDSPVYHYHSNYDSLHWMQNFGDPELIYHEAITRFFALVALDLIEADIIPFDVVSYSQAIKHSIKGLLENYDGPAGEEVGALFKEAHRFVHQSRAFAHHARQVHRDLRKAQRKHGFWNYLKYLKLLAQQSRINRKLRTLDQKLLYSEGLEDRPWFKHLVYAPGRYTGYAGQVFPGIAESLEDDDEARLTKWTEIITDAVAAAGDAL